MGRNRRPRDTSAVAAGSRSTRARRIAAGGSLLVLCLVLGAITGRGLSDDGVSSHASAQRRARTDPPREATPGLRAKAPVSAAVAAARSAEVALARAAALLRGMDPLRHRLEGDHYVSDLDGGHRAVLTLDPGLQQHLEQVFDTYQVPFGATVAIEPSSGRVLAYVSHSSANPQAGDLVRDATPPAASVFKLITAAALIDAGVSPSTEVCYGGGFSRLSVADLEDRPDRDRYCHDLTDAIGSSINAVVAKLALRNLDQATLSRYAAAFGFGHGLPFDVATMPSPAEVPSDVQDRLEFARTSAGFWHMHMSPLHAAMIAATLANDGRMARPTMVASIDDASGRTVYQHTPTVFRAVIPASTARTVGTMMERTVSHGTAHRTFFDARGNAFLPGIRVAGKTGTLSGSDPYRGYTWWVGFAPADAPTVAVASLVVNTPNWRIKASYVAMEALRHCLITTPREGRAAAQLAADVGGPVAAVAP